MIILRIKGGLGNQLFIYAFGLYLNKISNENVVFDTSPYFKLFSKNYNNFCKKYSITLRLNKIFGYRKISNFLGKLLFKLAKFNTNYFTLSFLPSFYSEEEVYRFLNKKKLKGLIKCIDGHFIRKDYALKIGEKLKLPAIDLSIKNKNYLKEIENNNSVSIHIRGKQYINHIGIKSTYAPIDRNYYKDAIQVIREKERDSKFYIFTNDKEYAKSILDISNDMKIVETNGPDYEHFYLMSRCDHNIIINSTFSWWAAFLNENKKKIIICPKNWSGEKMVNIHYDTLPLEDWIKV